MNILYGVCGEGFGHSSRAKEVIDHLIKKGHKVLVVTYGQAYPRLKEYNTLKIEGIHVHYDDKGISLNKTILENFSGLIKNITNWGEISYKIEEFSPNIGISDMEPIVPLFCYLNGLKLISIDNQHILTHTKINAPKKYKKNCLLVKCAVKGCVPQADAYIILSFTPKKIDKKKVFVVSPIVRSEILKIKPTKENHILVYQTKKDKKLIQVLKNIPENFIVYGYDKEEIDKNITYKKEHFEFIDNFVSSKAIIGTAGFSLISEAIYLKKPYFAIPLKGQFEQILNALFLKESGLGEFSESPKKREILSFIRKLNFYEENMNSRKINRNQAFQKLDKIIGRIEKKISP